MRAPLAALTRSARRLVLGLVAAAAFAPRVATAETLTEGQSARERPFRLGFFSMNPLMDEQKPLATLDAAGFVVNSGLYIGAFDDRWVGAQSFSTLRTEWWFDGGVTMTAPPGSFGSSVVLGFRDGKVVKLEALTGNRQWVANLDSFSERQFLLNGTTLYVLTAAQVLYAIDFQSGKTLWLYDAGYPDGLTIRGGARPIFHDGKIIFGIATGEILAVAADGGKLLWRYNPAYNDARFHDVVGELVVRNNRLIIARYDGIVAAIDLAGSVRSVVWQERLPGLTTATFRNARFYLGGLAGEVYAVDPENNGRRVWRTITGTPVTSIAAGETTLFVSGEGGRVTALDATSGNILWYDRLGSSLAAAPVLVEDAIYYSTGQKAVYAYKLR